MPPEAVGLAQAADADDLDARLGDPPGELLPLVAQRVGLRGGDEGGRQGVEPVGEQRREVGVVVVGLGAGVLLPVPGRLGRVEARLLPLPPRREAGARVEEGVDERDRAEEAGVAQGGDQGEVGAGRVAVGGVRPGRALAAQPADDRVEVVGRGGERVLGRSAVVHAQHRAATPVGDAPGDAVVDVDVVEHEAAAVGVHDETRERGRRARRAGTGPRRRRRPRRTATSSRGRRRLASRASSRCAARSKPGAPSSGPASAATAARTSGYITTVAPP